MARNHCGVLRKISGFFERQLCGYWCLRRPRARSAPASSSALITASLAFPFSPLSVMTRSALEAGRFEGEGAVLVDRIGDARLDAAPGELAAVRRPELEVLPAVAGRSVDEARSRLVGDVVALEQRDDEAIAMGVERMGAEHLRQSVPVDWRRGIRKRRLSAALNTLSASDCARM